MSSFYYFTIWFCNYISSDYFNQLPLRNYLNNHYFSLHSSKSI
uniref:Uncharacterized protein n=1 Tax=Arundo donax TaxID=35708 RepID=A0A0A9GPV0_ARUDO